MIDKIAIISDIHGNLEALKATIKDIEERGIKRIICLGDIAGKGTHFKECYDIIKDKCEVVVKGNTDYWLIESDVPYNETEIELKRKNWNRTLVNDEVVEFIKTFKMTHELYLSGSLVRMFHAAPDKLIDTILPYDDFEKKRTLFMPSEYTDSNEWCDIAIYGHLHTQSLEKIYNRTIVNTGSVGNSFCTVRNDKFDTKLEEIRESFYVIIEGDIDSKEYNEKLDINLVRVPYDYKKELDSEIENLEKENYEIEIVSGMYRDMTKINKNFELRGIDISKI